MNTAATLITAEAARVPLMLSELRLPTTKRLWSQLAEQSNREGWPAERFLGALLEHEMAERETRRLARARAESQLPPGKNLADFDFAAVSMLSKAQVMALAEADTWVAQGHNLLAFGPPGVAKTHIVAGIGYALIERGYKVLFLRTSELVQRLQAARRDPRLPAELTKLDRFDLLILDDLSYARRDQAETSVLFELIAERYERKSIAITANAPFSEWEEVFPDKAMTVAAVDRLVHHATILEMNVDSYRRRAALPARRRRRPGLEALCLHHRIRGRKFRHLLDSDLVDLGAGLLAFQFPLAALVTDDCMQSAGVLPVGAQLLDDVIVDADLLFRRGDTEVLVEDRIEVDLA